MLRGVGQLIGGFKPRFGTRAISSDKLKVNVNPEWYKNDPTKRTQLLGTINKDKREARRLDATQVSVLNITSSGLHKSADPHDHFTGRAFNGNCDTVWFFDTKEQFYTNGIHFYPNGLPSGLDANRFVEVASDDAKLIAWCAANGRDIKTGKKI